MIKYQWITPDNLGGCRILSCIAVKLQFKTGTNP